MFGKNQLPPKNSGVDTKMSKKQFPDQHNRVEAFRLGWDVPQNNKRGQGEITGKIGQGISTEEYQQQAMGAYQQSRQQAQQIRASSQQRAGQQVLTNNIFNAEPHSKIEMENVKGYGNFYQVDKQKRKTAQQDDDDRPQGYGQFYERNQQGEFQNIPRPAQSTKH